MLEKLQRDYSFWITWGLLGVVGNVGYTLGALALFDHAGYIWIWFLYAFFIVAVWVALYFFLMMEIYYLETVILSEELITLYDKQIQAVKDYTNSANVMIEILEYYGEDIANENHD